MSDSPDDQDGTFDFLVVANRLPVDRVVSDDGEVSWRRSPGGLVTAVEPVMQSHDGAWLGWDGGPDGPEDHLDESDMTLVPIALDAEEIEQFYEGFSNATLWPLYHDAVAKPEFHREWWESYVTVNRRFAERAARLAADGATVWVHDYQLHLVPAMLREARPDLKIGYFLHIPFPPTELFVQLPWRRQLLEGLLGADLVGFQRPGGAENFVRLVRQRVGHRTQRNIIHLPDGRTVARRGLPDLHRLPGSRGAVHDRRGRRARHRDPRADGQPRAPAPRASTGSTTPRASTCGSRRSASCSRRASSASRTR